MPCQDITSPQTQNLQYLEEMASYCCSVADTPLHTCILFADPNFSLLIEQESKWNLGFKYSFVISRHTDFRIIRLSAVCAAGESDSQVKPKLLLVPAGLTKVRFFIFMV